MATIGIIGYGAWRDSASVSKIKSDLNSVASAMENYRNFNNGYPSTIPTTNATSPDVSLVLYSTSTTSYCVDATTSENSTITYYLASESKDQGALEGTCATDNPGSSTLATPIGLNILSYSATTVNLSWTATSGATSYNLQCATDASYTTGTQTTIINSPATTGTVTSLQSVSTHYCHIKAINASSSSSYSANVTTNTSTYLPPTGLAVTTATTTSLVLGWVANVDASGYNIQCATNSGFTTGVQSANTTGLSVTISSLIASSVYYCRINATNTSSGGVSAWSSTLTTATALGAPTGLAVVPNSSTQINYSWTAASAATSYNIKRATNSSFTTGVVTVNQAGLSGSSTSLNPGTTYYYQLQYVNAGGTGPYSTPGVSATTTLPAPVGVAISGVTSSQAVQPAYTGQATISWTASAGAVTYTLDYATNAAFTGATSIPNIATTSRAVTGLYQGQVYYFRVYAVGSSATSAASSSVTGTTPIAQPPVPSSGVTYFSPAISHWANNQSVVVNWATYCPTNPVTPISVYNPNFTSNDWPPTPINYYYHAFGFSDWWSTSQIGPTATYKARYQCTNANGTSAASADSTTNITVN